MLIEIIFNVLNSVLFEISFCPLANNVKNPGKRQRDRKTAGTQIIEQNSQGESSLKALEKIYQEKKVNEPVIMMFANPSRRVLFIVFLSLLSD